MPSRTDEGEEAVPFLITMKKIQELPEPKMTRRAMYEFSSKHHGQKCTGCEPQFDYPPYLELDYNARRSDGGINHISKRILLCGPCYRLKSNTYTLSGLCRQSKERVYMANLKESQHGSGHISACIWCCFANLEHLRDKASPATRAEAAVVLSFILLLIQA